MTGHQCFYVCTQGGQNPKGYSIDTLDYLDGDEAGVKSVTIQVNGENAYGYLKSEKRRSPSGSYFTV